MHNDARTIPLGKGLFAIVSDQDYLAVSQLSWRAHYAPHTIYAKANVWVTNAAGRRYRTTVYLHRFIARPGPKLEAHHKNHNGLDCRRSNLLVCRHARNLSERRAYGSADYIGVSKFRNKWRACITVEGAKRSYSKHLGVFGTDVEAARAYDDEALRLHGEFANLNFPLERYEDETGQTDETRAKTDIPFPAWNDP